MDAAVRKYERFVWGSSRSFKNAFKASFEALSIFLIKIVVGLVKARRLNLPNSLTWSMLLMENSKSWDFNFLLILSISCLMDFSFVPMKRYACMTKVSIKD